MVAFVRAAGLAAMTFFACAMLTDSTPGFALGIDPVLPKPMLNGAPPEMVPVLPMAPIPDLEIPVARDAVPVAPAAPEAFGTLSQAVAAQSLPADMSRDLECLAGAVYHESKSEPLAGQLAVAQVILNRSRSGRFPTSICSVVTQPGQFSFVRGGTVPLPAGNRPAWRTAVAVAKVAMDDLWESPVPKALFFHARRVSPRWSLTRIASVGNHVFYR